MNAIRKAAGLVLGAALMASCTEQNVPVAPRDEPGPAFDASPRGSVTTLVRDAASKAGPGSSRGATGTFCSVQLAISAAPSTRPAAFRIAFMVSSARTVIDTSLFLGATAPATRSAPYRAPDTLCAATLGSSTHSSTASSSCLALDVLRESLALADGEP